MATKNTIIPNPPIIPNLPKLLASRSEPKLNQALNSSVFLIVRSQGIRIIGRETIFHFYTSAKVTNLLNASKIVRLR